MSNFTFLTKEQLCGKDMLEFFKNHVYTNQIFNAATTDFSILLGGHASEIDHVGEFNGINRAGDWWTKSSYENTYKKGAYAALSDGWRVCDNCALKRYIGARPVLPYSSIKLISSNEKDIKGYDGLKELEFGEYPQTVVDEDFSSELEKAYNDNGLKITGKKYTTDSVSAAFEDFKTDFRARTHIEYEYNGNKYIRFVVGDLGGDIYKCLSNGRRVISGDVYWVRVEPIVWLVDEKADVALTKKIIFAGVQFKNQMDTEEDFEKTNIKQFMDKYFSKDIIPSKINLYVLKEIKKQLEECDREYKRLIEEYQNINTKENSNKQKRK